MVRQGCFGVGLPVFPPFYGFLSHAPDCLVKCLENPMSAEYSQLNAGLRCFPDYPPTLLNYRLELKIGANKWDIHSLR
jgi:hypothetical protein